MFSLAPQLDPISREHACRVAEHVRTHIEAAGGWLPFDAYMHEVLYAPGLGYYAAGSVKLAENNPAATAGDFITAPELTPLFGHVLAQPVAHVLRACQAREVLEFGAGSGALAAQIITALEEQGIDVRYSILEVSPDLRARQQARLAPFGDRVQWLNDLPTGFAGCVIANEVLDAMPVKLFRWDEDDTLFERGVALGPAASGRGKQPGAPAGPTPDFAFVWQDRLASTELEAAVRPRMPCFPGYVSEINLQAEAFMRRLGEWLQAGAGFFIDYGFPRHEYYHPQRAQGTLMCHFRHRAHDDPLQLPGLQDITAHVDFTAMADAAYAGGLDILGYTSQARFLLDAGLPAALQALQAADPAAYVRSLNAVQKLISEAEMGELFKVLAVGREVNLPLPGFAYDRTGSL